MEVVDSLEQAVRDCDVVHAATSGASTPELKEEWFKPGAFISLPANIRLERDFVAHRCTLVMDNWLTYEAWNDGLTYPYSANIALLGCLLLDMVRDKMLTPDDIRNIGDIVTGKHPGRTDPDEIILFGQFGIPTYDVAWA